MKKFLPLAVITSIAIILIAGLFSGCDELVTNEYFYYDTIYIDSTVYEVDTDCRICHNDITDSVAIAERQWAFSGHASGNLINYDYQGQVTSSCGPECHTNEGFVASLEGEPEAVAFPTEIGCFTCHAPHTNRDFSLRLATGLCEECHHAVLTPPAAAATEISITSDWGPHNSTESELFIGTGGFEYDDYTYNRSTHLTETSGDCNACHMDTARAFTLGGHSLNITYNGNQLTEACNISGCHSSSPIEDIASIDLRQDTLSLKLAELQDSLFAAGLIDIDGIPVAKTISGPIWVADSAGALFNYLFVVGDSSYGVHNLPYALDLVKSSILFLEDKYTLTVIIEPENAGTVTLTPSEGIYYAGTEVTVQAEPEDNYAFSSWSGDLTGNPTTITIISDTTVTATFTTLK